jgi:phosphopantothenoylcysteine decarboxylase/phosphopantothenate--cysteine ligase
MGFALAEVARRQGADVTVVAANVALPRRSDITYVDVESAAEMLGAASVAFGECDLLLMAAAVADFRPAAAHDGKIDKSAHDGLTVELEPTADILATLSAARTTQVLVGFAAEHGDAGLARAREKRVRKGLDVIVHNDVAVAGIGFDGDQNAVTIIGPGDQETVVPRTSKDECAARILAVVTPLIALR